MAKQSVPLRIIGVCLLPTGSVPGASLNATQKQMLSFPNTPAAAPNGKLRRFRELRRFRRFDPRRGPLQTSAAALPQASSRRRRCRSQERLEFQRGLSPSNLFRSSALPRSGSPYITQRVICQASQAEPAEQGNHPQLATGDSRLANSGAIATECPPAAQCESSHPPSMGVYFQPRR